jgi:hypothetical protein
MNSHFFQTNNKLVLSDVNLQFNTRLNYHKSFPDVVNSAIQ